MISLRRTFYFFIAVFSFLYISWTSTWQLFKSMCGNEIVSEHPSPNGRQKVLVFVRSCGATTGYWTHVLIEKSNYQLTNDDNGKVLIIDDRNTGTDLNYYGGGEVIVKWLSDDTVVLRINDSAELIKKETRARGVNILYE